MSIRPIHNPLMFISFRAQTVTTRFENELRIDSEPLLNFPLNNQEWLCFAYYYYYY